LRLVEGITFSPDIVIREQATGRALLVIDTKYKVDLLPQTSDIAQVVAYAQKLECLDAVLLYPGVRTVGLDMHVGDIRVRTLQFTLAGDLSDSGEALMRDLALESPAAASAV
jgi:5-methylcytosine-specific restriction enzyme subunit McrC